MSNNKRYYIAYGSNLSLAQMAHRCPDAKPVGTAVLEDWELVFKYHATIEPARGLRCPVLVWEISKDDEWHLDRYEGFPQYYYKKDLNIRMKPLSGGNTKAITAMVYIMSPGNLISPPSQGYYDIIAEGYERFGFDLDILNDALDNSYNKCQAKKNWRAPAANGVSTNPGA